MLVFRKCPTCASTDVVAFHFFVTLGLDMSKGSAKKNSISEMPIVPDEVLAQAFPGGFNIRDEANALTAYAFRNGPLENLHAGKSSPLLDDSSLSRITDTEMKELMIHASESLARMLKLRESDPVEYKRIIQNYALLYCRSWKRSIEE